MSDEREFCWTHGSRLASDHDWVFIPVGEGTHLCWDADGTCRADKPNTWWADEIERLRAALEPFAAAWRTTLADPYYPLETVVAQDITTDQWRTAAETLDE